MGRLAKTTAARYGALFRTTQAGRAIVAAGPGELLALRQEGFCPKPFGGGYLGHVR
jgi:hypothetical protein